MKALSTKQAWANLISVGEKTIETRNRAALSTLSRLRMKEKKEDRYVPKSSLLADLLAFARGENYFQTLLQ